MNKLSVRVGQM